MAFKLDAERSIPQLAKMAGVSDDTMRRKLVALHRTRGDVLIITKVGNRTIYKSTLTKLRKAMPHLFVDTHAEKSDVDELKQKLRDVTASLNALAAKHREFQKKAHAWFELRRK